MTTEELLRMLGQLAREEEEERFERRWTELARGVLPAHERLALERLARSSADAALVERLTRPLTEEDRERLWRLVEEALVAAARRPPDGS